MELTIECKLEDLGSQDLRDELIERLKRFLEQELGAKELSILIEN